MFMRVLATKQLHVISRTTTNVMLTAMRILNLRSTKQYL